MALHLFFFFFFFFESTNFCPSVVTLTCASQGAAGFTVTKCRSSCLNKHSNAWKKNTEQNLPNVINVKSFALNGGNYCTALGFFWILKKPSTVSIMKFFIKKLKHLGVRGLAPEWFRSYLSNMSLKVYLNGELSDPETIDISVLQGTILGPILFLSFINDLPNSCELLTYLCISRRHTGSCLWNKPTWTID